MQPVLPAASDGNFAVPRAPSALPFTGERMTGAMSGQIEFEHLHRYCLARDFCVGRDVLDVASGEGYGTAMLAGVARSTLGLELDAASVAHAKASYPVQNLQFLQGDALAVPLGDASVDVVVSFETVEHVPDTAAFIDEIVRVLRPGGLLVMSTPDRHVYSAAGETPNPYHLLEMTGTEFRRLLETRFAHVRMVWQRPLLGSVMAGIDGAGWRSYERRSPERLEASAGLARAPYLVAIASSGELPALPSSAYLDFRRVHAAVEALDRSPALAAEAAGLREQLGAAQSARAQEADELAHLRRAHAAEAEAAAILRAARDRAELRAEALDRDLAQQNRHVDHLVALLAERAAAWERVHGVLDARTAEAARLGSALAAAADERNSMRASASWRLTRPVRVASRVAHRLLHACRLPRRILAARALARHRITEIAALRATRLLDAAWYLDQRPDLRGGEDAARHFAWVGATAGLMPNPYFDTAWYCARYPEVGRENPLLHWLREGAARKLDPNPFLRTAWYVEQHPEAAADPLLHWIEHGVPGLLDPNPMLDAAAYVLEYPAAQASGALLHWWHHGSGAGHDPHPIFDAAWYRRRHALAQANDPLAHWLNSGQEGPTSALAEHGLLTPHFAPDPDPLVSVIIPAYRHYADTWRCLYALSAHSGDAVRFEVIVADDCPEHRIAPLLQRRIAGVRWLQNPDNLGFLRSCNAAEKLAVGRYVVFLNNDAVVHPGWLAPLVRLAEADPGIGIVGCRLLNAALDDTAATLQEAGGTILRNGWGEPYGSGDDPERAEYSFVREVDVVVGACFLVRRAAFDALGGFDLRYAPAFYEEFDLAIGLRQAGYRTVYQPASRVTHRGSNSYGAEQRDRQSLINHAKFCAKWADLLPAQPAASDPVFVRRQRAPATGTILVIDDRVPEWNRSAGALTVHQYIAVLREEGFRVVYGAALGVPATQPYLEELQQQGVEVLLGTPAIKAWLRAHGRHLDFVWIARPDVAGPLLPSIQSMTDAPVLYYTHDLHYLRERRRWELEYDPEVLDESKRLMRLEHAIFATVDQVMTPSPIEAAIIRAEVPSASVHVIPPFIVAPTEEFSDDAAAAEPDAIMFVGGFAHLPNVDAAMWLVSAIMPLVWASAPDLRVLVVGDAPPLDVRRLAGERVEVTGFVADLAPLYARAVCTVSPLRYGAGVKGKVVASIQAGVPVVTTTIGNEGLDLQDGVEAIIADSEAAIADAVVALWRDAPRRLALRQAAIAAVRDRYSAAAAVTALRVVTGLRQCRVCGARDLRAPDATTNWREAFACRSCHALNRMEALAEVLLHNSPRPAAASLRQLVPALAGWRVHEFGFVGPIAAELAVLPGFSCSDFFPGVAAGTTAANGVRCEDMTALSFDDASFDLLISQDVLEHVPDARAALAESWRVLKPGGRLVFSVPYDPDRATTAIRAHLTAEGHLMHLLPAEFHGDPVRQEGALVFREFGRDLVDMLAAAGFAVVAHERVVADQPNGYLVTFEATRPHTVDSQGKSTGWTG